jgi:hypothetical protein
MPALILGTVVDVALAELEGVELEELAVVDVLDEVLPDVEAVDVELTALLVRVTAVLEAVPVEVPDVAVEDAEAEATPVTPAIEKRGRKLYWLVSWSSTISIV